MTHWVFGCDESGSFGANETLLFLVGGILLPELELSEDLHATLLELCRAAGVKYPPHGTELRQANRKKVDSLLEGTVAWLRKHHCWFVGLACKSRTLRPDPALHARMLGALVELSGRVAAAHGAEALTLHPASRGFIIDEEEAQAYRRAGVHVEKQGDRFHLKGVMGGEVREALDSLRRAPSGLLPGFPKVDQVAVKSAAASSVHPTVIASDLLCNLIYSKIGKKRGIPLTELGAGSWWSERMLLVDYSVLPAARAIDEALRREPPNLLALSEAWERLSSARAQASGESDQLVSGTEGALSLARVLWHEAEQHLVRRCESEAQLPWAITQRLAGDVQAELDMKHGAYAGTARALRLGFCGDNPLAKLGRAVPDSELMARLYRLTLESCNHCGDTQGGRAAYAGFTEIFSRGGSLSMLAEALTVENLANVLEQNELPADSGKVREQLALLGQRASDLLELTEATDKQLSVFTRGASVRPDSDDPREQRLRELLGASGPQWLRLDRQHGRAYGTAARSFAFCGDLDRALKTALKARCFFADSPFDLRMNACVMARMRAEQARLGQIGVGDELLLLLVDLAGATPLADPEVAIQALRSDVGNRFAFDILLRWLLWNGPGDAREAYGPLLDDLRSREGSRLYGVLRDLRSHPTELIARHAAELLVQHGFGSKASNIWFDLSLAITEAASGSTLARFSPFTRALRESQATTGPPGSLTSPTFEYR